MTVKGEAANNYYISSRKVSVKALSVGDFFREDRSIRQILSADTKVNSVGAEMITFKTKGDRLYSFNTDLDIIKVFSAEENQNLINLALEYQAKLTKKGELKKKYL